jgi:hypothetical protein
MEEIMRQERASREEQGDAPVSKALKVQIENAIRQAVASGADEVEACHQVMAVASGRLNRTNARRSFKMVIQ